MIKFLKSVKSKYLLYKQNFIYKEDIKKFFLLLPIFKRKNKFQLTGNKIIIEFYWDNPGYWFSIELMLNALSIDKKECIGVISKRNQNYFIIRDKLKLFGITQFLYLEDFNQQKKFDSILESINSEKDLLKIKFPFGFSNDIIYDELCKLQKSSNINVRNKQFKNNLKKILDVILASHNLISKTKPKLLITSHNMGVFFGSLCHFAIINNCKVFTLTIEQNSLKFLQFKNPKLQHKYGSGPSLDYFNSISKEKQNYLIGIGSNYLKKRLNGKVNEVTAFYAYNKRKMVKISRDTIMKKFGWNINYPILTLFASNYIDLPRSCGLKSFLNFREFVQETISFILKLENIYIILKTHPADEFYPLVKNSSVEYYNNLYKSNRFNTADLEWDNTNLINLSDGIITSHGTVGIEATHLRKPVLCANEGWYGHIGFVDTALNRQDFFNKIKNKFWEKKEVTLSENKIKSDLFSGWYYCDPCHEKKYSIPDPFLGIKNYKIMSDWLQKNQKNILKEIVHLEKWSTTEEFSYHAWKIKNNSWKNQN